MQAVREVSPQTEVLRESQGYELLGRVIPALRDTVRQALDQGCTLEPRTSGGAHSFSLVMLDGNRKPVAGGGHHGLYQRPGVSRFQQDLRSHGLVIDGRTVIDDPVIGRQVKRVPVAARRRREAELEHVEEEIALLQGTTRYADEVYAIVDRVCRLEKRETTIREVGGLLLREGIEGIGEVELRQTLSELFAHSLIERRPSPDGESLYCTPGFHRSRLAVAASDAAEPDTAPAAVASAPTRATEREELVRTPASVAFPALTPQAWQALRRAAEAIGQFCQAMAEQEAPPRPAPLYKEDQDD